MSTHEQKRILILGANPKGAESRRFSDLRLDEEIREIKHAIRSSQHRDRFEIDSDLAVTARELQLRCLTYRPHILHICSHGKGEVGLLLENKDGKGQVVSTEALTDLCQLLTKHLDCVILNACYSEVQAKAIAQQIPHVIGMNNPIGDTAAICFATGFYNALGAGCSYPEAFGAGRNLLQLEQQARQKDIPVYFKQSSLQFPASPAAVPSPASLWVHGWEKDEFGEPSALEPTVELDWTAFFDRATRQIATAEQWQTLLFPQLEQARATLAEMGHKTDSKTGSKTGSKTIAIQGLMPLTVALAVGFTFPVARRYSLQVYQRTRHQTHCWRSDATPSAAQLKPVASGGEVGENLLLVFGITGSCQGDAEAMFESEKELNSWVYLEPEQGTGGSAIATEADAVALAIQGRELLNHYRQTYRARCIHLVLYAPAGFAVLLGQQLGSVGAIVAYERTQAGGYRASYRLETG